MLVGAQYFAVCLGLLSAVLYLRAYMKRRRTARDQAGATRTLHLAPLLLAFLLLALPELPLPPLDQRFLPLSEGGFWVGAALSAAGLLFAAWARVYARRTQHVLAIKSGRELIVSGPYAWVRHPLYTGVLFGFAGAAIALGEWRGIAAVLIALATLWAELRHEEEWLRRLFGSDYAKYQQRVCALIPFLF